MNDILRQIPKVDEILKSEKLNMYSHANIISSTREILQSLRQQVVDSKIDSLPSLDTIINNIINHIENSNKGLRSIINASGIVIHTNLGRSCISQKAAQAVYDVSSNYSNLEYDIYNKKRGSRLSNVEFLLQKLTKCESALVVNNNAAAVFLILRALFNNKEVVVSRGELVEIGGSFRIPDILSESGAILKEVGTTNKTHGYDYIKAINENTGAILKVHTSNYKIIGFTQSQSLSEVVSIAREHNLVSIEDLGSGAIEQIDSLYSEPSVKNSLATGVDIVCFSGDKLFGGPQAGIILGKKKYLDIIKNHPLMRAFRIDKMSLAAMEITIEHYLNKEQAEHIPSLKIINQSKEDLYNKAIELQSEINMQMYTTIIKTKAKIGGGSAPEFELDSYGVQIDIAGLSANVIEQGLRLSKNCIVSRIINDKCVLDVMAIFNNQFRTIANVLRSLINE